MKPWYDSEKSSLVNTLASLEIQRRGDAGGRLVEIEVDFAHGLLWTIARTETNVLRSQWTRAFLFPVQILLGSAAAELVLAGVTVTPWICSGSAQAGTARTFNIRRTLADHMKASARNPPRLDFKPPT